MGKLINLNPLTDTDIPETIARDTETTAAIAAHVAATDPHPSLWTRITNAFLTLTGGQTIIKNNPAMSIFSYASGQNHLECRTTNGSNPVLGFHRSGFSATALYHLGYGDNSLRIRNADGFDGAIIHEGNIASKIVTNRLDNNLTIIKQKLVTGITPATPGYSVTTGLNIDPNNLIGFICMVGVDQGGGSILWLIPPGFPSPGYAFTASIYAGALNVRPGSTDSANMLNRPFKALITYLG